MADPFERSVQIDSAMGNIAGALQDFMGFAQEIAVRSQVYHALKVKEGQIRSIMPPKRKLSPVKGPVLTTPQGGVLCVVWINKSQYPDPGGNTFQSFKRLDVIGAYPDFWSATRAYETRGWGLDSFEPGWVSVPNYLWLTP